MFEESVSNTIPSIWASMNSWFTPAVLFVLLNVMIGTIAFTSTLANQKQNHRQHQQQNYHHQNDDPQQPKLARSPSVLQRLRSINFYNYRSQEPHPINTHFKTTTPDSDSDSHYNFEQTHHQGHNLEAHSQYIFEQTHQEKQSIFEQVRETQTQYLFQQAHEDDTQENRTHIDFEQAHEESAQENRTHLAFQQTHEENYAQDRTHFVLQQTDAENYAQEDRTHFVFPRNHEEIAQKNGIHFDFERAHEENAQKNGTHFDFERTREENVENEELQSLDEVYSQLKERHVSRSKSDTKPAAGEIQPRLPAKMKKSASLKSAFKHFEEEDIVEARRPATVRERGAKVTEVDEEVDAKADDFINRFKQQLKLQRLDSILRYKDMLGRGSGR